MLAYSDRIWSSLDFLVAGDAKLISTNLFCVFAVFPKDGTTRYAFVSVTIIDSILLTVTLTKIKL